MKIARDSIIMTELAVQTEMERMEEAFYKVLEQKAQKIELQRKETNQQ